MNISTITYQTDLTYDVTGGQPQNDVTTAAAASFLPWESPDSIVSVEDRERARTILRCVIQEIIIILGIPGNMLCLIVFAKQGLRDRVNLLLFSLAIADLTNLVSQFLLKCSCFIQPFDALEASNWEIVLSPNVLYYGLYANFVSGMLIVIMAVDRCLSVVIPLKASMILSFRRMLGAIVFTYLIVLAGYAPTFFLYTVMWVKDPETQRSRALLVPVDDYAIDITIPGFITTILTLIVKPVSIVIVVLCSTITVVKLRQATRARSRMQESQNQVSQSETKITKMLLMLSLIYIVCILPDACGALANYFVPEFFLYKKHHNIFVVYYETIFAASCLNSSANFLAYVWLSSKFRTTLQEIAPCFRPLLSLSCLGRNRKKASGTGFSVAQSKSEMSQITSASVVVEE